MKTDIVNEYFRRFYPPDADENWEMEYGALEYWRKYKGKARTIFPEMKCSDGFHMSVQGHWGAYSTPRDDFAENYSRVEVGFPSAREELLMQYAENPNDPTDTVYGFVPVEVVAAVIEKHGGLVE